MDKQFIRRSRELEEQLRRIATRANVENLSFTDIFRTADKRWLYKWTALAASCAAAVVIGQYAFDYMKRPIEHVPDEAVQATVARSEPSSAYPRSRPLAESVSMQRPVQTTASIEQQVTDFVTRWKTAWETGVGYSAMYASEFVSDRNERLGDYLARKRGYKASRGDTIKLRIYAMGRPVVSGDNVCVAFRQEYDSSEYNDSGIKELCIRKRGNELDKIIYENWRPR